MYWFDELKNDYLVKGEPNQNTNQFEREVILVFDEVDGERVPRIDEATGKQREYDRYIDRDVYIECARNNRIYCLTSEMSKKEAKELYGGDLYMACINGSGAGMNILRKYYVDCIGNIDDICLSEPVFIEDDNGNTVQLLNKNGEPSIKNTWYDDVMFEGINNKGDLIEIELLDGEIYFKSINIKLLCEIMGAKKSKGKSPFSDQYLLWESYDIPEDDSSKYDEIWQTISDKFDGEKIKGAHLMKSINGKFKEKYQKLDWNKLKYTKRIKKFKELVHSLGIWDEYLKFIKNNI